MAAGTVTSGDSRWPWRALLVGGGRAPGAMLRSVCQRLLLFPALRWFTGPLVVSGPALPAQPVVLVANHASHADTAAILRALPGRRRRRTVVGAAGDYFFGSRLAGLGYTLLIGTFPFPRSGRVGLDRTESLLASGWTVLLYPQGTRGGRDFRRGVGLLHGATVVPVGLAGTREVLPKGTDWPRPARVAVRFGDPVTITPAKAAEEWASSLQQQVVALSEQAEHDRADIGPTRTGRVVSRLRQRAEGSVGLAAAFFWGFSEALVWPFVPDVAVAVLAVAAPRRWLRLGVAATAGSVAGGLAGYLLVANGVEFPLPLTTPDMHAAVREWYAAEGPLALWRQPLSGVPYKVFVSHGGSLDVALAGFVGVSAFARGARILAVALVYALFGAVLRRLPRQGLRDGAILLTAVLTVAGVALGLAQVVQAWS